MSAPGPSSIPTSASRPNSNSRSKPDPDGPPPKKRRALSPTSLQATHLSHLFAHPDTPIRLTDPAATASKNLPAPPEIVTNVQGSSAGAGSGEFHVYKAARRREYERLRAMDEEVVREKEAEEFEEKRRERERLDEEKTRKNREKREKKRLKGKGTGKSGATTDGKEEKKGGVVARKDGEKDWDEKGDDVGGARPVAAAVVDAGPGLVIHDDD